MRKDKGESQESSRGRGEVARVREARRITEKKTKKIRVKKEKMKKKKKKA